MDLFFNELSLSVAPDRFAARTRFQALGELLSKSAASHGLGEIKVASQFFSHTFASDYTFYQWTDDKEVDQDFRTLLKSRITTTPVIDDMLLEKEHTASSLFQCLHEGTIALGLGAASPYFFDSIAISMHHNVYDWNRTFVETTVQILETEAINEQACSVRHALGHPHFEIHDEWIKTKLRPSVPNGKVLWLKRGNLYPNLIFCAQVQSQLAKYSGKQPEFIQLQKRLEELEAYAAQRTAGHFDPDELPSKVSPESATRGEAFANELTQQCSDGVTRFFDWHSRFTPGAGRIHFYPLEDSQSIIIGSIANQNTIK